MDQLFGLQHRSRTDPMILQKNRGVAIRPLPGLTCTPFQPQRYSFFMNLPSFMQLFYVESC